MRNLPALVSILCLLASCMVFAEGPGALPRVAVLYSDHGQFRHRDDYDAKLAELGWPMDKYENTQFADLAGKLSSYDILLGSALYNYSNPQDLSAHADELLGFLQQGGAVVLTDANYTSHLDWLANLGDDWRARHERCGALGTPNAWFDREHPLFSVPNRIPSLGGTWAHMIPGEGWDVLSRCEDKKATGLFRQHGKGFMMVTGHWPLPREMLQNVWGALMLYRGGVLATMPRYASFDLGSNTAAFDLTNVSAAAKLVKVSVRVEEPDQGVSSYEASAQLEPGATEQATFEIPLIKRGPYKFTTNLAVQGTRFYTAEDNNLRIPDLLTVQLRSPKYRSSVYLPTAGDAEIGFHVSLHPHQERLADLMLSAHLSQGGELVAALRPRRLRAARANLSIPAKIARPGDITLSVSLSLVSRAQPLTTVTKTLRAVAPQAPQVSIGEDLATRVDGEVFFPIGVYHISVQDLPRARELGFNCFQGWGTTLQGATEVLDAAQNNGMKVLLEMSNFLRGRLNMAGFGDMVEKLRDHPALLAWYTVDEPAGEQQLSWCRQAYQHVVDNDPHHPVYLVMCRPGSFERFGTTTDILAVDPYPIPNSVVMVSDWMKTAQDSVQGLKPVWVIPQLHNWAAYHDASAGRGPTPAEERNMVYQGLIWGAKGVIYYPWDDGPTGLIHDPVLMQGVGRINGELAMIGPALLGCQRHVVAHNDDANPGLYAALFTSRAQTYIIAASVLYEQSELAVPAPGIPDGELEVMFEDRWVKLSAGKIQDGFEPLAVHVYRLR